MISAIEATIAVTSAAQSAGKFGQPGAQFEVAAAINAAALEKDATTPATPEAHAVLSAAVRAPPPLGG